MGELRSLTEAFLGSRTAALNFLVCLINVERMNLHSKSPIVGSTRHDLVNFCKNTLVCAARDLAEFTRNGINAGFIVALAYKCDSLEATLDHKELPGPVHSNPEVENEVREAVRQICDTGRKIFDKEPAKYRDYVISGF